jgi:hypothetical protein
MYIYNSKGMLTIYEGDSWKKEGLSLMPCKFGLYPEHGFGDYQYFDNFTFNGETYYINSVIKLSKDAQRFLGSENEYSQIIQREITNLGVERWAYVVKIEGSEVYHTFTTVSPDQLVEEVTIPATLVGTAKDKTEYYSDLEDPDVIIGWIIYIAVMIGSLIFIDFGAIWGFASIVFFVWRHNRLKKPKKHNYGFDE